VLKDETGAPRQIMAATPEFCVLVNPFIAEFAGVVKRRLQVSPTMTRPVFYAPGANAREFSQIQEGLMHRLPCGANADQAKWDSSQQQDCGKAELGLFSDYGCPLGAKQLLSHNLDGIHGYSREGVVFKGPYMRQSGDGHTTVGNTILAAAVGAEIISQSLGREATLDDMFLGAGGDDGSLMTAIQHPDYEVIAAKAGFPVTLQRVSDWSQMEFLGCRLTRAEFINLSDNTAEVRRVYMPSAGRMMAKLAYSVNATQDNAASIAKGAAQSFLGSASGCPPLHSYVRAQLRLAGDVRAILPKHEAHKMTTSYTGEPCAETWVDLELQYGWTTAIQVKWDEFLGTVRRFGEPLDCAMASLLISPDHGRLAIDPSRKLETSEVTYDDCAKEKAIVHWSLSQRDRNAEQHAANGNGSVATAAAVLVGHAAAATHSASQFGEALRKIVPAIKGACKAAHLPEGATEAATEAFVTAAWDHVLANPVTEDPVVVARPQPVLASVWLHNRRRDPARRELVGTCNQAVQDTRAFSP